MLRLLLLVVSEEEKITRGAKLNTRSRTSCYFEMIISIIRIRASRHKRFSETDLVMMMFGVALAWLWRGFARRNTEKSSLPELRYLDPWRE